MGSTSILCMLLVFFIDAAVCTMYCLLLPFVQAFMTIVWTVLELMFVFFFFKLPIVEEHSEEKTLTVNEESVTNEGRETQASGYGAINSKPDIGDSGSTLNDSEKEESGSKQPLLGKNAPQNVPKLKKMVHIMFGKGLAQ